MQHICRWAWPHLPKINTSIAQAATYMHKTDRAPSLHYMGTAVWSDCGTLIAHTNDIHNTSLAIMYMLLSTHTSLIKHLCLKVIKGHGFLGGQASVYEVMSALARGSWLWARILQYMYICDRICENRPPCKICTLEIRAFECSHVVLDPNIFYYTTVILGPLATSWWSLTPISASVRAL